MTTPDLMHSLFSEDELRDELRPIIQEILEIARQARRLFAVGGLKNGRSALRRIEELAGDGLARAGHPNPDGLCLCGCGGETTTAPQMIRARGLARDAHRRFLANHDKRPANTPRVRLDSETGCWVWQWGLNESGYGLISRPGGHMRAHRAYYELLVGPIPDGLHIDHLCRNRACVNPDHLEPVTCAENLRRGARTKLTAELVAQIKREYEDAGGSLYTFAHGAHKRYGVSKSALTGILRGTTWKDIEPAPRRIVYMAGDAIEDAQATPEGEQ